MFCILASMDSNGNIPIAKEQVAFFDPLDPIETQQQHQLLHWQQGARALNAAFRLENPAQADLKSGIEKCDESLYYALKLSKYVWRAGILACH